MNALLRGGRAARHRRAATTREVVDLELDGRSIGRSCASAATASRDDPRAAPRSSPPAASNRTSSGCSEAWGDAADNFIIRGTPYNTGALLRLMLDAGAEPIGDPRACHAMAVDARAPKFDGGIVTRLDCMPLGIVVNQHGERFSDEGEDLWPKRYAIWGTLIARQPGQIAYRSSTQRRPAGSCRRCFRRSSPTRSASSPRSSGSPATARGDRRRVQRRGAPGHVRSRGARRLPHRGTRRREDALGAAARHAAVLRLSAAARHHVHLSRACEWTSTTRVLMTDGSAAANIYAAGRDHGGQRAAASGYIAGIGMTIGTVFGRIAGEERGAACPRTMTWSQHGAARDDGLQRLPLLRAVLPRVPGDGAAARRSPRPTSRTSPTCATTAASASTPASTRRRTSSASTCRGRSREVRVRVVRGLRLAARRSARFHRHNRSRRRIALAGRFCADPRAGRAARVSRASDRRRTFTPSCRTASWSALFGGVFLFVVLAHLVVGVSILPRHAQNARLRLRVDPAVDRGATPVLLRDALTLRHLHGGGTTAPTRKAARRGDAGFITARSTASCCASRRRRSPTSITACSAGTRRTATRACR